MSYIKYLSWHVMGYWPAHPSKNSPPQKSKPPAQTFLTPSLQTFYFFLKKPQRSEANAQTFYPT